MTVAGSGRVEIVNHKKLKIGSKIGLLLRDGVNGEARFDLS